MGRSRFFRAGSVQTQRICLIFRRFPCIYLSQYINVAQKSRTCECIGDLRQRLYKQAKPQSRQFSTQTLTGRIKNYIYVGQDIHIYIYHIYIYSNNDNQNSNNGRYHFNQADTASSIKFSLAMKLRKVKWGSGKRENSKERIFHTKAKREI